MGHSAHFRRAFWLALLVVLAFLGLGYRLVELQVVRHQEFVAKAQKNTQKEYLSEPRRGDILDTKGNILATTVYGKTVCAAPDLLGNCQVEVAHVLAPLLDTNETALAQLLSPRVRQKRDGSSVTNQFVLLKRRVPLERWEAIRAAMTNLAFAAEPTDPRDPKKRFYNTLRRKAVFARDEPMRAYPNHKLAAHVLGYVNALDKEINNTPVIEIVGVDGIERTFNERLAGMRGWRVTETDRQLRELVTQREQELEARDGCSVALTIDSVIQHIVETTLAEAMERHTPISASGIVVRPRTGEVLALATLPNFDPNAPGQYQPEERRNRVVTDIAEPGSTFKVIVVSGALNEKVVRLSDLFDCEHGRFFYGGRTLHDHEPLDILTVERIITKSSNIGAAKIGIQLGAERLYDYISAFGFGTATGLPLPSESSARLFVPPPNKWRKVSLAQIPMGHGISATRMQMVMAMAAIANKGWLMRPMLVDRLVDVDHHETKFVPQRVRQVISEATARQMIQALKTVATPEGTAPKAALENYSVAGKTGTAQKVENGNYVRKYFASFIGFFPADNPELCISVTLDEPRQGYYGGETAAPFFKKIAERSANYLNIRPKPGSEAPGPGPAPAALATALKAHDETSNLPQ